MGGSRAGVIVFSRFLNQFVFVIVIMFCSIPPLSILLLLGNELAHLCFTLHLQNVMDIGWRFLYEKAVFLLTIYHLFMFTDMTNQTYQTKTGSSIIAFIIAQSLISLLVDIRQVKYC